MYIGGDFQDTSFISATRNTPYAISQHTGWTNWMLYRMCSPVELRPPGGWSLYLHGDLVVCCLIYGDRLNKYLVSSNNYDGCGCDAFFTKIHQVHV